MCRLSAAAAPTMHGRSEQCSASAEQPATRPLGVSGGGGGGGGGAAVVAAAAVPVMQAGLVIFDPEQPSKARRVIKWPPRLAR